MTEREQKASEMLQSIARDIKNKLPEGLGFTLLAYEFEKAEGNRLLYVSNSNREDVIKAMLEFIEKNLNDESIYGKDVD